MKKVWKIVIGGIQQKLFNLVLATILLVSAAFSLILIYQIHNIRRLEERTSAKQLESIQEVSSYSMQNVFSSSQGSATLLEAAVADKLFANLRDAVETVGGVAAALLSEPEGYAARAVLTPDAYEAGEEGLQLLAEEGVDISAPEIAAEIGLLGNMETVMKELFNHSLVSSCFFAAKDGFFLIVDNFPEDKVDEEGRVVPFPIHERPWYREAVETGSVYFTDVEHDSFSERIGIVCALPVYVDGKLAGVAGADLFLDEMAEAVAASGQNDSFVFIVNQEGHVIFSPQEEGVFAVRTVEDARDLRKSESAGLAAFVEKALSGRADMRLVNVGDDAYYMTGARLDTVGWAVVSVVSQAAVERPAALMQSHYRSNQEAAAEEFYEKLRNSRSIALVLLLLILVITMAGATVISKRIVKPLEKITKRLGSLGGNDLEFRMEDAYRTGDEIEVLAEAFARISHRTLQYVDEVARVSAEKERIGTELEMAKAIQASQLPSIFPPYPDRPEFDLFAVMTPAKEVGGDFYDFYLLDQDHIALVMADVSGKGVPAALFMMISRILIKTQLQNGGSPGQVLENVNRQLLEGNETGFFVTVWLAVIQISTGDGVAANAGHEHPALMRAGGRYELVIYRHSLAVAAMEGVPFREHGFHLDPGDSLFVYTDGVPEASNADKELFGTERMLEALNREPEGSCRQILKNVQEGIAGFVGDAEQFDDITMLCFRYMGPEPEKEAET